MKQGEKPAAMQLHVVPDQKEHSYRNNPKGLLKKGGRGCVFLWSWPDSALGFARGPPLQWWGDMHLVYLLTGAGWGGVGNCCPEQFSA